MNWQVSLLYQLVGMCIISFLICLIGLGVIYTYFSSKSARIQGLVMIALGWIFFAIFYILGKYFVSNGVPVPWWNIFKIEGLFADLGAFCGFMIVIGLIMLVIIRTDRRK